MAACHIAVTEHILMIWGHVFWGNVFEIAASNPKEYRAHYDTKCSKIFFLIQYVVGSLKGLVIIFSRKCEFKHVPWMSETDGQFIYYLYRNSNKSNWKYQIYLVQPNES